MKRILSPMIYALVGAGLLFLLHLPPGNIPPLGVLIDPWGGLIRTARLAHHPDTFEDQIPGLEDQVEVIRDQRGVPHIFAQNYLDGVRALAYATAQDRLFQMDFIPRVASGRLSEVFGPASLETDRFLRNTGMAWGARKALDELKTSGGIEWEVVQAYVEGVNAYIDQLDKKDYPFEFRLLGYGPERYTSLHLMLILQYMTFDLTYRSDDPGYQAVRSQMEAASFSSLFPQFSTLFEPIIPEPGGQVSGRNRRPIYTEAIPREALSALSGSFEALSSPAGSVAEGFIAGKGSNNWAVNGALSATGAPILAGDMHLSLSLPAIWYEVHLVTPEMNTYGVVIPGAPVPVEAFNDYLGWAYTNTGTDQIDFLALSLSSDGRQYRVDDVYRDLSFVPDTIRVRGQLPVVDTLRYSHWGPVAGNGEDAYAINWVAHYRNKTLLAQINMNRATDFVSFQEALKHWDSPMQNVLYADIYGNIAIRSTGFLPIRSAGHGMGMLDGSTEAYQWEGRVPFEELPYSFNPERGYLTSTNQQPADSTYPYYQGYDWGPGYRSLRIDALLSSKDQHTVEDLKRYQADVYVVQRDLFVPLLQRVDDLSEDAELLKAMLETWNGDANVDRNEPLVLDQFLENLEALTWDEDVFDSGVTPGEDQLYRLLVDEPFSTWLDRPGTEAVERASDILGLALEATVDSLHTHYGTDPADWRWGDHHKLIIRHLTRNEALRPLWRGPYEFPGFQATLSPAGASMNTHSASWRVVVDFSTTPPTGYGVYPGGQSGNPFSDHYDNMIETYVQFEYNTLLKPASRELMPENEMAKQLRLLPQR